jgi:transposase
MTNTPESTRPPARKPPRRRPTELPQEAREEILQLHRHYGTRRIAARVGLSRKVVRRVLEEAGPAAMMSGGPCRTSKLAPFLEKISELVAKDLTVTRILREIRGIDPKTGYCGGRTILAEHVRALRGGLVPPPRAKRRFETRAGLEMQIDWSLYTVPIDSVPTKVHCLGCLLCWSRRLFIHFFRDERQSTLLEGLAMAFEYFQGAPERTVLDNMAQAILGRIGPDRKPLWNPRFYDFIKGHYGSEPFPCRVKDPDRKGKKEKSFRLVEDDFLKGSEFASWEDLNARARTWLDETPEVANSRIHGTTRLVPNEAWLIERDALIRLPEDRFAVYDQEPRLVDEDSTLSIGGTRYSVPEELAGRAVSVRLYAFHFEVLNRQDQVVFSRRYVEARQKGKLIIDPSHYAPSPRQVRDPTTGERIEDQLLRRFPKLEPLVTGLKLRMKTLAPIHFSTLLRLARRYGDEPFLEAAERVQRHRRFDAGAVKRILEHDHPLPQGDVTLPPLGNAAGTALLGEVDLPTLDSYGHLDGAPAAHDPQKGDTHGA